MDPVFDITIRSAVAFILLGAAWHKLRAPYDFWGVVAGYQILPTVLERPLTRALPFVELLIALMLFMPVFKNYTALAAICLFSLYAGAIFYNLMRGRTEIDCGCGGFSSEQRIHMGLVGRNIVIIALIAATLGGHTPRDMIWFDGVTILGGTVMLLLLFIAADTLMRNHAAFQKEARS